MAKLKVTYAKSAIGYAKDQKATIASLGLRKLGAFVVHPDTPTVRGMLFKVKHLVAVEEVADDYVPPAVRRFARPVVVGATTATFAAATTATLAASSDDLEKIEGIGPKIAGLMRDAGVTTFAQLAAMDHAAIKAILNEGGVRADPTTWPQQAQLAAEGRWEEFQQLLDQLVAGRVKS